MASKGEEGQTRWLEGRGALVTGSSSGIGREIALTLANHGAKLVVHYSSNHAGANEAVELIKTNGGHAVAVKADISDPEQVKRLFDGAEAAVGQLHVVVNNAGVIDNNYNKIMDMPVEDWDRIFTVNSRGTFLCTREAARRVVRGGGGRIINITSTVAATNPVKYGAYAASKASVETMTKVLAKELRGSGITANCVAPGAVDTEFFFKGKPQELVESLRKAPPLERLGKVTDVTPLVAFLSSDQGEWVNAQVVRVNGGVA